MTKKVGFKVEVEIIELGFAPYTSGFFFAKLKNGSKSFETQRREVKRSTVQWNEVFSFECTIPLSGNDLVAHELAISLRREEKGGRDLTKLGKRVINLSEFAMKKERNEVNILLGDTKSNASFHLIVNMRCISGGPIYGAPPFSPFIVPVVSGSAAECAAAPPSPISHKLRTIDSLGSLSSRESFRDSWVFVGRPNPEEFGSREALSPAAPTPLSASSVVPIS